MRDRSRLIALGWTARLTEEASVIRESRFRVRSIRLWCRREVHVRCSMILEELDVIEGLDSPVMASNCGSLRKTGGADGRHVSTAITHRVE